MRYPIFILFGLVFIQSAATASEQNRFVLQNVAVLDSTLDNKKLLLPRVFDTTLWILLNGAHKYDSLNSCYTLYNNHTKDFLKLVLPDSNAYKNHIVQFFVEKDRIILIDLVSIMMFRRESNNQWKLSRAFPLTYTVFYARMEGDVIQLWNDIPSSFSGKNSRFYCWSFDLKKEKEEAIVEFPESAGVEFMYVQPRNVLDRTAKTIALADVTNYVVRIYNASDTSLVDTIARQPEQWICAGEGVNIPLGTIGAKRYFRKLDSLKKRASLINRVTLINDTTLFMAWSTPVNDEQNYNRWADIWRKQGGVWLLTDKDIPFDTSEDSLPFTLSNAPLSVRYVYSNSVFLDILSYPLDRETHYIWNTYTEYQKELDRYFSVNPVQYIITTRRFVP